MGTRGVALGLVLGAGVAGVVGAGAGCSFTPAGGTGDDDGDAAASVDGAVPDGGGAIDAPFAGTDAAAPVDGAPLGDARPPCPGGYDVARGGSRYARRGAPATVDMARLDCGDDLPGRTRLATFEVAADLDPVIGAVSATGNDRLWLGATCSPGMFGCEGAASWRWDTGVAIDVGLWISGEPDNPFTEHSVITRKVGPDWLLASSGTAPIETHPYVCECEE